MELLSEAQTSILRRLSDGRPRKAPDLARGLRAPARDEAIRALEEAGLVATRIDKRSLHVELTPAGRERIAALPAARRTPAGSLDERVAQLEERVARLEAAEAGTPAPRPAADLKPILLDIIAELDTAHRYGGLVPLPDIRREVRRRERTAGDLEVNAALEELEREYAIDLNIAQSPTTVPDRQAGIERPGRGLIYYVARRGA